MKKAGYIFLLLFPLLGFSQAKEKHNPLFTIRGDVEYREPLAAKCLEQHLMG